MLTAWCRTGEVFALAELESGHWDSSIYARRSLPNEHFLGRATFCMKPRGYLHYINKSDHWKQLRQQKFSECGKVCCVCGSTNKIHVHHIRYRDYVDCTTADLAVLCEPCHHILHDAIKCNGQGVAAYDTVALIKELVETHKAIPRGKRKKMRRVTRQRARSDRAAQESGWKRECRMAIKRFEYNSYSVEALKAMLADFEHMLKLEAAGHYKIRPPRRQRNSIEHLLLNYSATESPQPGTALEVLKTVRI